MTEALTTLATLGPISFLAGIFVGWVFRDQQDRLGRTRRGRQ